MRLAVILAGVALLLPAQSTNGRPRLVSVSPNFGTGYTQAFQFVWSDPDGADDLAQLQIIFTSKYNDTTGPSCYLGVAVASQALTIHDEKRWSSPSSVGSLDVLETDNCKVDPSTASLLKTGNEVRLNLKIQFKPTLLGARYIQTRAWDRTLSLPSTDARKKNGYDNSVAGIWTVGKDTGKGPLCQALFSPTQDVVGAEESSGYVEVVAPPNCRWSADALAPWIRLKEPHTHVGPARLEFSTVANPSPNPRIGTIKAGMNTASVQQAGQP